MRHFADFAVPSPVQVLLVGFALFSFYLTVVLGFLPVDTVIRLLYQFRVVFRNINKREPVLRTAIANQPVRRLSEYKVFHQSKSREQPDRTASDSSTPDVADVTVMGY